MIRGLYTSLTGMATQQKRMEVVTNNLANANTPGFKEDSLLSSSFAEMMVSRMDASQAGGDSSEIGTMNSGVHIDEILSSFTSGALEETGLATDFALTGDGFFTVAAPDGERYTRSGAWTVSADGYLTTQEGYLVQGNNGAVRVGGNGFSVSEDGNVSSVYGQDKLKIAGFGDLTGLRKQGDNTYTAQATAPFPTASAKVRQGFLETSNVDLAKQMVDMIEISRSFEINQRMLRMQDERLGKSVNEIGRL